LLVYNECVSAQKTASALKQNIPSGDYDMLLDYILKDNY